MSSGWAHSPISRPAWRASRNVPSANCRAHGSSTTSAERSRITATIAARPRSGSMSGKLTNRNPSSWQTRLPKLDLPDPGGPAKNINRPPNSRA